MLNILGRCFRSDHTWYGSFMWITISESALQRARHVNTFCKHRFAMLSALQSLLSVYSRPLEGRKYVCLSYSCLSFHWELEYHRDTNTTLILGFFLFFSKRHSSKLYVVSWFFRLSHEAIWDYAEANVSSRATTFVKMTKVGLCISCTYMGHLGEYTEAAEFSSSWHDISFIFCSLLPLRTLLPKEFIVEVYW